MVLPSYRLLEMCFLIGLYFHDSTDYNGVTFSDVVNRVTKMGSHFWDFESSPRVAKIGSIIGQKIDQT